MLLGKTTGTIVGVAGGIRDNKKKLPRSKLS